MLKTEYYLPEKVLTNAELVKIYSEWTEEKIFTKTGIASRHVAGEAEDALSMAEVFDCDAGLLKPETELDTLQWDSMAMLSVIAFVKAKFDKKLPGAEIRAFKTVGDILNVME